MYITWRNNNNTIEFIDWIYNQYSGELDANKPEIEKIYNMFSIVQT
jgi:hypothetical protein